MSNNHGNQDTRAEDLFVFRLIEEETEPNPERLTFAQLYAFVTDPSARLTHQQQRLLFSNPRLRADYQRLKAAQRWRAGEDSEAETETAGGAIGTGVATSIIIRPAAAAGGEEASELNFKGGRVRMIPSSVEHQVYIMIQLNDPNDPPRSLFLHRREEIAKVALPAPESDGTIFLLKDLNDPEDARFVRLLRDLFRDPKDVTANFT
jgi:hypothetical protein